MFNKDFYPTPVGVIGDMMHGVEIAGRIFLEPNVGKGNIAEYLVAEGAKDVIGCELDSELYKIAATKCKIIAKDFLTLKSDQVSHIDGIVMNPPFSEGVKHILHAYEIAPPGCIIRALCNYEVYTNPYSRSRQQLASIIHDYGNIDSLGTVFDEAERTTGVNIGLISLTKPGQSYSQEFDGFFLDDEPEEAQANGIMPYNFVRELVNRYVAAVKLFDEQIEIGKRMNALTHTFYTSKISFSCTEDGAPKLREDFKKDLQKNAWQWVFNKMNMQKYTTKGLKDDINKFVEKQTHVPFTMRNIYTMIEIVIGTTKARMDRAIIEVFEKLTTYYHDNRYNVEGWKTNSHYLMGEKFILPYMVNNEWGNGKMRLHYNGNYELVDDMVKALCYITGTNYDDIGSMWTFLQRRVTDETRHLPISQQSYIDYEFGKWYEWGFFEIKGFKKGTMHFKFKDQDVWARFNQHIARIKGYPLPEAIKRK